MKQFRSAASSLCLALLLGLLLVQTALAAQAAGVFAHAEGGVSLRRQNESRAAKAADPVQVGDTIVTAADGKATVRFQDDSLLVIGPSSQTRIDDYVYEGGNGRLLARFAKGSFRAVTGKIVKQNPQGFNMLTPLATIGVRGSDIFALVQPEAEDIGALHLGDGHKLEVTAGRGRGEMDAGGLFTHLTPDGAVSEPRRIPQDLLARIATLLSSPAAPRIEAYMLAPQSMGQPSPVQNGPGGAPNLPQTNVPSFTRTPGATSPAAGPTTYVPPTRR